MRKTSILLLLFIFVLGTLSAYAEVKRVDDSFNGSTIIHSNNTKDISLFNHVALIKSYDPKLADPLYVVGLSIRDKEWWFFSNNIADFKFDDAETISSAKVLTTNSEMLNTRYAANLYTTCLIGLDKDMISKILNAQKITLRIYYTNHTATTWTVPAKILEEWKQVINCKK